LSFHAGSCSPGFLKVSSTFLDTLAHACVCCLSVAGAKLGSRVTAVHLASWKSVVSTFPKNVETGCAIGPPEPFHGDAGCWFCNTSPPPSRSQSQSTVYAARTARTTTKSTQWTISHRPRSSRYSVHASHTLHNQSHRLQPTVHHQFMKHLNNNFELGDA
jgi:hypothetical protein